MSKGCFEDKTLLQGFHPAGNVTSEGTEALILAFTSKTGQSVTHSLKFCLNVFIANIKQGFWPQEKITFYQRITDTYYFNLDFSVRERMYLGTLYAYFHTQA